MYDIFLVGKKNDTFEKLKSKFILSKYVETFEEAQKKTLTDFFWVVWDDLEVDSDFDFEYEPDAWSQEYIHAFLNDELYNGVCLFPKNIKVSQQEITERLFNIKKEVPMLASRPKVYDTFEIDTWDDYERALEESSTDMFWMTSANIKVDGSVLKQQKSFERNVNHAFLHNIGKEDVYNGVYLLSKSNLLTRREIEHRHIVNRKEWDIIASKPVQYDIFTVDTWEEYQEALSNSKTELFWTISRNIEINPDFKFDKYFNHDNSYDRNINHVFIHRANNEDYYNGVFLCSKHSPLSKREIDHRHIINRKEWQEIASYEKKYDVFIIDTWEQYRHALENSTTELFWGTSANIDAEIPNLYFVHNNEYDRKINHAFVHRVKGEDYHNGLFLFSKHAPVTQREIEHRHIVERKEWNIVGSHAVKYDIFEIDSWDEYQAALVNSKTELFWMSSRNIEIDEDFMFDVYFTHDNGYDRTANHAFIHKVNGVTYYNGLFLCSKHTPLTNKEVENRFIVNVKEWEVVASGVKQYEIFAIDTYEEYQEALAKSKTELFYGISRNIEIDFDFDIYFPHNNRFDRITNHAFVHRVDGIDYYNGVFLFSKHAPVTPKEIEHRHIVNCKEWNIVASGPKQYNIFTVETYEQYLAALENSTTEMFWAVTPNVYYNAFEFDIYFMHNNEYDRQMNHAFTHLVDGEKLYNGVFLLSKYSPITKREIENRFIVNRKEWDTVASIKVSYDVFNVDTYEEYQFALENSNTEMFWGVSKNISLNNTEILETYFTHDNEYDRTTNHAFAHLVDGKKLYNGLFLFSKHNLVTQREIEHRHIVERKEWDTVVSGPVKYEIFTIDTYEEYQEALTKSNTEMFYGISGNIEVDFKFDIYFPHDNEYDRITNHAFVHRVDGVDYYNGVFLFSKHAPVTPKEIEHRHIINRKEWNIVASGPGNYDYFIIENWDDYQYAIEHSTTEMFWADSHNIDTDNFAFDTYFVHNNEYDRQMNHAFTHLVDGEKLYNGVFLLSKHSPITKREIENRFIVNRKEWDTVASTLVLYNIFTIDTWEQYEHALETSETEMFWGVSNNVSYTIPELYFSHDNEYDRTTNHAFIHRVGDKNLYNGIFLFSKHAPVTQREIEHRYLVDRKEWDIVVSGPKPYSIVGCKTYEEYLAAINNSTITELFWTFTPNIKINPDFSFDLYFTHDNSYDRTANHTFIHRVNGEDYRNGLFLLSKHSPITEREFNSRFIINAKEWDIVASSPVEYDVFTIDSYADYKTALQKSTTEMFWGTSANINATIPDIYFTHNNEYDRQTNHAFIHRVNEEDFYNGLFLFSIYNEVTAKEIEKRFIVNRKEWDIVGSTAKDYEVFVIDTYEQYQNAIQHSITEMFWGTSANINATIPDVYFTHDNEYDRKQNHAFIHRVDDKDYYNGLFLCSKHRPLTQKEIEHRHIVNLKEWEVVASTPVEYPVYEIDSYEEYQAALNESKTEMFWGTSANINATIPDVYFTHDNEYDRKQNHAFIHRVDDKDYYNGLFLCSKHRPLTQKEIEHRHIVNSKEWDIIASVPVEYDVFTIDSYEEYQAALNESKTEMFWMSSANITATIPDIYFTHDNEYDRKQNHAFIHKANDNVLYNGLFLCSKHRPLTQKEVEHRHIVNRKEWNIVASGPKTYDIFTIDSYEDYLNAYDNTTTEMFWGTSANINATIPDIYFTHNNEYDRQTNHAFIHRVNGKDLYNGLFLFSKHEAVSQRELEHRHIVAGKEWDIVASGPKKYDIFTIDTYVDYLIALKNSTTEMFWATSCNIKIDKDFVFNTYFSHNEEYDRHINHAFAHKTAEETLYNGLFLLSKHAPLTEREVEHRHLINKKEWDIVASGPIQYQKFYIDSYEEYEHAFGTSKTEMFWVIPSDVDVVPSFEIGTEYPHNEDYNRNVNHAFLNGEYYDGIWLCSQRDKLSKREFDYRCNANKHEVRRVISKPKLFDIVFISYQESNADENYERLLKKAPNAKRIHGVKGIHQAHIEAAKLCTTDMFWIVDGDAIIMDDFNFDYQVPRWERDTVHVWRSQNPINDLIYGYGGVKLFPRELTLNMDTTKPDMTTSISNKFRPVQVVSNITKFNTGEFETWKSAFRECVKLASKVIDRQKDDETAKRLQAWCKEGAERPYGEYAIAGAKAGFDYGVKNRGNTSKLKLINDFDWLKEQFNVAQK